eukprot:TRINITY_DN3128_c0_g1_i4.p2 TRINITY_DN3128_c0_g1~~TRINITY_DN3128_c0_g1_i4.p2  ORF type:complete len:106 (-),score=35.22 TRINITY_DN3128_c0_g1_i4:41-358(-)
MSSVYHIHETFKELSSFTEFDPLNNYQWNKTKSDDNQEIDLSKFGKADYNTMNALVYRFEQKYENMKKDLPAKRPREEDEEEENTLNPLKKQKIDEDPNDILIEL